MPVPSEEELRELRRGPTIAAALAGPLRLHYGKTRVVQFVGTNDNPLVAQLVRNQSNLICFVSIATVAGNPFTVATFSMSDDPSPGSDPQNDFMVVPRFNAIVYPGETFHVRVLAATRLAVTEVWF